MIVFILGNFEQMHQKAIDGFRVAASELEEGGDIPMNLANLPYGLDDDHYFDIGLSMLKGSEAIRTIPGWEYSPVAHAYAAMAEVHGIKFL